ncbi:RHS repeat domain-containing protein [Burkholderia contaminans]
MASSSPSAPFVESAQSATGDRLHQFVTSAASTQTLVDFTYDGHGNRTARAAQLISDKPSVKPAPGILERLLPRHNASEPSETTLPPHVTRYRYDAAHQLIGVEHADGGRTEYRYDALGRRIAKIHTSAGQASRMTLFVWDNDWMLQEVYAGTSTRDYALVETPTTVTKHSKHGRMSQSARGY